MMTPAQAHVRRVRYAAGRAGLALHYDKTGGVYALHGDGVHHYGLTLAAAETLIGELS